MTYIILERSWMDKLIDFWKSSYRSDSTAFMLEMFSFVVTVAASMTLALHADNPNMLIVYPGFFVGSLTAIIAYHRRRLVWPYMLTIYFAIVNVFGFGVAAGWW